MANTTVPFIAMPRRQFLRGSVSTLAALAIASPQRVAEGARDSAFRILCSGPAGSIPDLLARRVGERVPISSGARTWIDNRSGARFAAEQRVWQPLIRRHGNRAE